MALRLKRGIGAATDVTGASTSAYCNSWLSFMDPACSTTLLNIFSSPSQIAPPPAPTGSALTLPPASGEDAAALAQSLSDQQMRDQQALAAAQVKSSWWDQVAGSAYQAGVAIDPFNPPGGGVSWLVWVAGGIGLIALAFMGGGSPRRYGR
jgi:hypothetical protein